MDIELIDFVLAAGGTARLERAGRYIEIIEAQYELGAIVLTDGDGQQAAFIRGALAGTYAEVPFKALDITNGANAQTVTLLVTDGKGGTRRQPGVVQVVDTRVARTKEGRAYSYRYSTTAAAGQYATTTLNNPAGSGKRIVVEAISLGTNIAGGVSFGFSQTGPVVGASILTPRNKLSGGAATVAVVNSSSSATQYGGTGMLAMDSAFLQASATQQVVLQEPIVLLENTTFVMGGETLAQQIAGRIEYFEEPI